MPFVIIPSRASEFSATGDLWVAEYAITYQWRLAYTASVMEFRNRKVAYETQYFGDPFEAPGRARVSSRAPASESMAGTRPKR